jgi:hypothetical protein
MTVCESVESAFGTPVKGVEIKLTLDEARMMVKLLQQSGDHPPMDSGGNVDYDARRLGGSLKAKLNQIVS